jgi:hypothetical protein
VRLSLPEYEFVSVDTQFIRILSNNLNTPPRDINIKDYVIENYVAELDDQLDFSDPEATVRRWMRSETLRSVLLSPYHNIHIRQYQNPDTGTYVYLVIAFDAQPKDEPHSE